MLYLIRLDGLSLYINGVGLMIFCNLLVLVELQRLFSGPRHAEQSRPVPLCNDFHGRVLPQHTAAGLVASGSLRRGEGSISSTNDCASNVGTGHKRWYRK